MKKRITHDSIHGSYYLPNELWTIIDTPEFQRLRDIKQTGNTYLVYMCANHTRFEHSLGVAYLCGLYGKRILHIIKDEELPIIFTKRDILILQIAGLCHDLGHSAFSHLFDSNILPALNKDIENFHFTHETASFLILSRLNSRLNILTHEELCLVGKLIYGSYYKVDKFLKTELKWNDLDNSRIFMFQILSNEIHNNTHLCSHLCNETNLECNGYSVDVDKFDYLKRDSLFTGIKDTFDYMRLIEFSELEKINITSDVTHYIIKYDKKAHELIKSMWTARNDLHRRVYKHRVVKIIDEMYVKAFIASAPYLNFTSETGEIFNIKDIYKDMSAYCKLTDKVIYQIMELSDKFPDNKDLKLIKNVQFRILNDLN